MESAAPPLLSVIVPTRNRPAQLAECLQSLASLDYPRERFEVIVVQDGGAESLVESIAASLRHRLDLKVVAQPHAGPASARNAGAARARGELLVFTDDDCRPIAGWLRAFAARFAAAPTGAVGGRTVNALPGNVYSTASQLLIDYLYGYYNVDENRAVFFASNNLAVPASRFHALGGFDRTFPAAAAEDRDLCDRWLHQGYAMSYAPDAVVCHAHPLALKAFWRQHFEYGRGAFAFHRARARRGGDRIRVEPLRFYVDLLRYSFVGDRRGGAVTLAGLLALSQLATVGGFAWAWLQSRASPSPATMTGSR